jgi:hypothetical protein
LRKDELEELFDRWYAAAVKFLNPTGPHGDSLPGEIMPDYWIEFTEAHENAKVPLDAGVIDIAWQRAKANPLPPEALQFSASKGLQLLIALFRELQKLQGKAPVFVPTRTFARFMGHKSNSTTAMWLRYLVREKLLEMVEPGGPGTDNPTKSTRYRYLGSSPLRRFSRVLLRGLQSMSDLLFG